MLTPRRQQLIERAYAVFARYRSHRMSGCAHCVEASTLAELNGDPRAVSRDEAFGFSVSVMGTIGNATSFKRLLPRLLELDAASPLLWEGRLEQLLMRAEFPGWPAAEREAVEACLEEALFDQVLCATTFSDRLLERLTPPVVRRLVPLIERSAVAPRWYALLIRELGAMVEAKSAPSTAVFMDWLLSRCDGARLEGAFFEATDAHDQRVFSTALQVLEWFS